MALNPTSYTPNPYFAFVWLKIRGEIVTLEDGRPQTLLGFDYVRDTDNTGNIATVNLIDKEKDRIEPMLVGIGSEPVYFKYGYTTGLQSPWFSAFVQTYNTDYVVEGTLINITLATTGILGTVDKERKKSRAWKDKLISEIVEEIATQRGWVVQAGNIDKTKKVEDNSDLLSAKLHHKQFTQQNMTDEQFITEVLLPLAIRDSDSVAGYKFFFEDDSGSSAVVHFHPPRLDSGPVKTFHYMSDKMSEVLSFKPNVIPLNAVVHGAGVAGLPYIDLMTGEYGVEEVHDANTPEKTLLGGSQTVVKAPDEEKQNAVPYHVVRDKEQAKSRAKEAYMKMFNNVYTGTLVCLGDPTLLPQKVIRVIFTHKSGKIHYSSGLWLIQRISDSIRGGKFTSSLAIQRTGMREEEGVQGTTGTGKVNV